MQRDSTHGELRPKLSPPRKSSPRTPVDPTPRSGPRPFRSNPASHIDDDVKIARSSPYGLLMIPVTGKREPAGSTFDPIPRWARLPVR
jgi:hypothetical protein